MKSIHHTKSTNLTYFKYFLKLSSILINSTFKKNTFLFSRLSKLCGFTYFQLLENMSKTLLVKVPFIYIKIFKFASSKQKILKVIKPMQLHTAYSKSGHIKLYLKNGNFFIFVLDRNSNTLFRITKGMLGHKGKVEKARFLSVKKMLSATVLFLNFRYFLLRKFLKLQMSIFFKKKSLKCDFKNFILKYRITVHSSVLQKEIGFVFKFLMKRSKAFFKKWKLLKLQKSKKKISKLSLTSKLKIKKKTNPLKKKCITSFKSILLSRQNFNAVKIIFLTRLYLSYLKLGSTRLVYSRRVLPNLIKMYETILKWSPENFIYSLKKFFHINLINMPHVLINLYASLIKYKLIKASASFMCIKSRKVLRLKTLFSQKKNVIKGQYKLKLNQLKKVSKNHKKKINMFKRFGLLNGFIKLTQINNKENFLQSFKQNKYFLKNKLLFFKKYLFLLLKSLKVIQLYNKKHFQLKSKVECFPILNYIKSIVRENFPLYFKLIQKLLIWKIWAKYLQQPIAVLLYYPLIFKLKGNIILLSNKLLRLFYFRSLQLKFFLKKIYSIFYFNSVFLNFLLFIFFNNKLQINFIPKIYSGMKKVFSFKFILKNYYFQKINLLLIKKSTVGLVTQRVRKFTRFQKIKTLCINCSFKKRNLQIYEF